MGKFDDLTGKIFGYLTVLERAPDRVPFNGKHVTMWRCKWSMDRIVSQPQRRTS